MSTKKILLVTLLLIGSLLLAACATDTEDKPTLEATEPPMVDDVVDDEADAYPAPDEDVTRPVDDQTYPVPDPDIAAGVDDPYPGVDDESVSSDVKVFRVDDFTPIDEDEKLTQSPVFIHRTELVMMESYPVQVQLTIFGDLPTPCNQLRLVVSEADEDGNIAIEAYSVIEPDKMCAQVLYPFKADVPVGDFTEGNYTISINGESVDEFELP